MNTKLKKNFFKEVKSRIFILALLTGIPIIIWLNIPYENETLTKKPITLQKNKEVPTSMANRSTFKQPPSTIPSPLPTPTARPPTLTPTPSLTTSPVLIESTLVPTATPTIATTKKPWTINGELTCTNCLYAPVDKQNKLSPSYIPQVINTDLPGGQQLTFPATQALQTLFKDAKKQNINIKIVSAYRSYQTQQKTFNYWTQQEMKQGYNRQTAEERANNYSAKPGHSEHQLGTTVDLSCLNCQAFDNSAGNQKVYDFLRKNAYKYGFVISYTPQTTKFTGYKGESWHIRFIGKTLATELYNLGYLNNTSTLYLAKFLTDLPPNQLQ